SPRPLVVAAGNQPCARSKSSARRWGIRADANFRRRQAEQSRWFSRPLALLDQFPKLAVLAELVVFRQREFAAEKEIPKRVLVQDAVNGDPLRPPFEVDPVILRAITMQLFPLTLDHTETARVQIIEVFGKDLEFRQQLELQRLRQCRH